MDSILTWLKTYWYFPLIGLVVIWFLFFKKKPRTRRRRVRRIIARRSIGRTRSLRANPKGNLRQRQLWAAKMRRLRKRKAA